MDPAPGRVGSRSRSGWIPLPVGAETFQHSQSHIRDGSRSRSGWIPLPVGLDPAPGRCRNFSTFPTADPGWIPRKKCRNFSTFPTADRDGSAPGWKANSSNSKSLCKSGRGLKALRTQQFNPGAEKRSPPARPLLAKKEKRKPLSPQALPLGKKFGGFVKARALPDRGFGPLARVEK